MLCDDLVIHELVCMFVRYLNLVPMKREIVGVMQGMSHRYSYSLVKEQNDEYECLLCYKRIRDGGINGRYGSRKLLEGICQVPCVMLWGSNPLVYVG